MISLEDSKKLLKLIGDEFIDLYLNELFKFKQNVILLIDDTTFYLRCINAVNKMNSLYSTNYSYEDCLDAYDNIHTNFIVYENESLQKNNQLTALAIAVYQVLLAYKELPGNVNPESENGYYSQLKDNYPSLRVNGNFSNYFHYQSEMWETVKQLFLQNSKNLLIPEKTTDGYRNVKYPHSQRVLTPGQFRLLCSKFQKLPSNKNYSILDFATLFSNDLQGLPQKDFITTLLYNAYKSVKSYEKPKYYSTNDESIGILYFDEDGNLTDEYTDIDISEIYNKPLYFYQVEKQLWCTEPSDKEVNVGVLCKRNLKDNYSNLINRTIPLSKNDYIFIIIEIGTLRCDKLYNKFYSQTKQNEKHYTIVDGLKIDGRNNSYSQFFLPDIIFDFDCPLVKISDNYGNELVFETRDNILRLSAKEIKNQFKGLITIQVPNDYIPPIQINIVIPNNNQEFKNNSILGWDLEKLSPVYDSARYTLIGLKLQNTSDADDNENKTKIKSNDKIPLTTPYVNCNYSERIYITNYVDIKEKIKSLLKQTCKFGNQNPISMIIETLKKRINDFSCDFQTYISYYRLIKQCILELYEEKQYVFIIFYASDEQTNELKPFIKRIHYIPDVYRGTHTYPFFDYIKINGRRPSLKYDTSSLTICTDKLKYSLKHITSNINYQIQINSNIVNNEKYAFDYLEYCEILLRLENVKSIFIAPGIYKFKLDNATISDIKSASSVIDFSRFQKIENIQEKVFAKNDPLRYLQQMFFSFIQLKGCVTWKQITDFMIDKTGEYTVFDVFFPLYNVGIIDVCWNNLSVYYYINYIKIETSFGIIKSRLKFPDFARFPAEHHLEKKDDCNDALNILRKIPPLASIIKNWTKVSIDNDRLIYGFSFGSSDGFDKPKYKRIQNEKDFKGLCRESNDKRLMAISPAYFKFSISEIYQVPNRSKNPNAERIAKIVMRSLNTDLPKRFEYNKSSKELICHLSDIPIPILRALFIADPIKLGMPELFLNKKENNRFSFIISDEILKELKRIMSDNLFEEIQNA